MSNISHNFEQDSLEQSKNALFSKIKARGDLPNYTVDQQIDIVEQLADCAFGQFLIQNRGVNGNWTHEVVFHPKDRPAPGLIFKGKPLSEMDLFLFEKAPVALATQQRFEIFQKELQKEIRDGIVMASIPCGVMGDLLTLDYSIVNDFTLIGMDIDKESLEHARVFADINGLAEFVEFREQNAWELQDESCFDVLTSNGLNIYEPDDNRVIELYRNFHSALKPGGLLVTSFVTPPPTTDPESKWDMSRINQEDLLLQKTIFVDIIEAKWQCFRTWEQTLLQLEAAGFENIMFIYDKAGMFPTVLARKDR